MRRGISKVEAFSGRGYFKEETFNRLMGGGGGGGGG